MRVGQAAAVVERARSAGTGRFSLVAPSGIRSPVCAFANDPVGRLAATAVTKRVGVHSWGCAMG